MRLLLFATTLAVAFLVTSPSVTGQSRDEKVRGDREALKDDSSWFYDDLESGIEAATRENKPLMVVLRCIP